MLKIVFNSEDTNREIVKVPWDKYFKREKITKYFDDTDRKIVEDVEKTSLINNNTIEGKFSDMPIGVGNLSEGCKTLLCINHAIKNDNVDKYLFNITSCGGNAISYLAEVMAKNVDIEVYVNHSDFGESEKCSIEIDGQQFSDAIIASNHYTKIVSGGEF